MSDGPVVLGGIPTRVVDEGTGPTVVLVHATPFDLDGWSSLAGRLRADHRVIRYDLRGHGAARGNPVGGSAVLAHDLVELLDLLEVPEAHVVGHSFGGTVSQRFTLDHPERVRRLSLIGARASPSPVFATLARALRHDVAARESSIERWFPPDVLTQNGPVVRYTRRMIEHADVDAWMDALAEIGTFDVLARLPELRMPVDLVVGADDHGAKPEHMEVMAGAVPGSHFHLVAGGPVLPFEHPDVIAPLLA